MKYVSLLAEMPRGFDGVGFKSANFETLAPRDGVQIVFNTHLGDLEMTEFQCARHPEAVFCTNDPLPTVPCRQVVSHYPYGKLSYKKLQCLSYIHKRAPEAAIALADIDTVLACDQPTANNVLCVRVLRGITHDRNDVYYSFNAMTDNSYAGMKYRICLGAYLFIPNRAITLGLRNLARFEHYGADDLALTFFFEHQLGIRVESLGDKDVSGTRACDILNFSGATAMQCNSTGIDKLRRLKYDLGSCGAAPFISSED